MPAKVAEHLKIARMAQLKKLRDDRFEGSNTLLARALGRQPDYISRAIRGNKVVGEALAREIEATLGLPLRWLDGEAIEDVAAARAFLDAPALERSMSAVDRWILLDGARLAPDRRAELVCTLYELFYDQPAVSDEQMITFLRRQARLALSRLAE